MSKITICNTSVHPGEVANLALPLPEQHSFAPLYMPIKFINGTTAGPCLVILSGIKGTELNGLETVNRIISEITSAKISGTIIAIPVMNVYALSHYPLTSPGGKKELYKCFPGCENGSFGERLAYLITEEILKKADYCIELQTGGLNHNILPQVYCNFDNRKTKELAKVFRAPVVTNVSLKDNLPKTNNRRVKSTPTSISGGRSNAF